MIFLKKLLDFDYARSRDFDLKILMGYEISTTCLYLTKRGLIQKPNKSELTAEVKSMITKYIPTHLPPTSHHRNVIIDFMAYARSVNKKAKSKNIQRFFQQSLEHIQLSFQVMQSGGYCF